MGGPAEDLTSRQRAAGGRDEAGVWTYGVPVTVEPGSDPLAGAARDGSVAERRAAGLGVRKRLPRLSLGTYESASGRPDPVALLASQETVRVPVLVPIRHARMSVSPFTFYRGAAIVMAGDLAARPDSGLVTQLCGDAHLSNFGMFAAPDRSLVFDINDFDETTPGPFEWDVLRLATSFVLAGRDVGLKEKVIRQAAESVGLAYRTKMADYAALPDLAVWYDRIDIDVMKQWAKQEGFNQSIKRIDRGVAKARTRDSWSAVTRMTEVVDGHRRFLHEPPLLVPFPPDETPGGRVEDLIAQYRATLLRDRALLLSRYHLIDLAHKVVGVGSVGLLAFVALMEGRDADDLLVLQVKQAVPSVLEPYAGASIYPNMGERVVVGQRIMQAASDVFLGWIRGKDGRDFYVRQLRDMKFAPDPTRFDAQQLVGFALLCGRTLARAHARSGDAVAISSYLGSSAKFDGLVRDFALAYTEQVNMDFARYHAAIADGRVSTTDERTPTDYSVVAASGSGIELTAPDVTASSGPASS